MSTTAIISGVVLLFPIVLGLIGIAIFSAKFKDKMWFLCTGTYF